MIRQPGLSWAWAELGKKNFWILAVLFKGGVLTISEEISLNRNSRNVVWIFCWREDWAQLRCWTFNRQKVVQDWVQMRFSRRSGKALLKIRQCFSSEDENGFGWLASELPLNIVKIPSQNLPFLQMSLLNSSWVPVQEEEGPVKGEKLNMHVHWSHVYGSRTSW